MKALMTLCCAVSFMHAADTEITVAPLKYYPGLISEVIELWWQGQGELQKTHAKKPIESMTQNMLTHLNDNTLPLCLIALKQGKLVGMVRLTDVWTNDQTVAPKIGSHPEWSPWVCGLIIDELHRKQGIGNTLLAAIQKKAVELGYRTLYIGAHGDAQAWYERHGYKQFDSDTFRGEHINLLRYDVQE